MLRIAGPFLDSDSVEAFESWSHHVLNTTSRLRDCDAALEWLTSRVEAGMVSQKLARRREKLWRQACAAISPLPGATRQKLARTSLTPRQKVQLEERFEKHSSRLEKSIRIHTPRFLQSKLDDQHRFRRKLRRLRYLREIALPRRQHHEDPWLSVIIPLQTATGECQNLTITGRLLARFGKALVSSALLEAMSRERAAWEKQIRKDLRKLRRHSRR